MDQAKNFAKATVDGVYEAADTEIDVLTSEGSRFPTPPFNAVWWNATDYPDPSDDPIKEIVRVTAIATDTLTITRAQEGTAAEDHNEAGKTYKLIAGPTARTITDMIGNIFDGVGAFVDVDAASDAVDINGLTVQMGDIEGAGVGTKVRVDDGLNLVALTGKVGTDQTASATVAVGTLAAKMPIYDLAGDLIGYIPIYSTIT